MYMIVGKMRVKETVMIVAATFVFVNVQERRLEKGNRQGQVHQDRNGKPHTLYTTESAILPAKGITPRRI
jgi:hypothetical protein